MKIEGPNKELFCSKPKNRMIGSAATKKWENLVDRNEASSVSRFMRKSEDTIEQEHFPALVALYTAPTKQLNRAGLGNNPEAFRKLVELFSEAVRLLHLELVGLQPEIVFTQLFEGRVTSADKKRITVEFKVEDDLEDRQFDCKSLKWSQPIREGQAIQARCHLEIVPPKKPMTDDKEIQKRKKQYRNVEGYLKKAKRGRNLIEEGGE